MQTANRVFNEGGQKSKFSEGDNAMARMGHK